MLVLERSLSQRETVLDCALRWRKTVSVFRWKDSGSLLSQAVADVGE